jgi:hypothetical protein
VSSPYRVHGSLQEFEENIQYARGLIAGGIALQGMQSFPAHPDDLYRAAWSQAVSAMDHWLHNEIIERAVRLANDVGNQRPQSMLNLKMPFEMVERINIGREPSHVVFRDFLEREYGRKSFHSVSDINEGMRLVAHLSGDEIWHSIGNACGMTLKQARDRHNEVIKRRNDISHRADRGANGHRQPMTDAEASAAVDWVADLVHELLNLLG